MDLYFPGADAELELREVRACGATAAFCSDWHTRRDLLARGMDVRFVSEALALEQGKALDGFCIESAQSWFKSGDGEDITLFRGVSLGQAYSIILLQGILIPFFQFQEAARLLLERGPERVWASASLPPYRLEILRALCPPDVLNIIGTAGPARPSFELTPWSLPSPFARYGILRRLYNLFNERRHPRLFGRRHRRWIISPYLTLVPLYAELSKLDDRELELAFFQWPGKAFFRLWPMRNLRILASPGKDVDLAGWKEAMGALRAKWAKLREEPAYRARFAWNGLVVWPALEKSLSLFFEEEAPRLGRELLEIQAVLSSNPVSLIAVALTSACAERLLVEEGRKRGIPTATILHGLPGVYWPFDNVHTDYLLAGGAAQVPLFEALGVRRERVLATGMPHLDLYAPENAAAAPRKAGGKRVLVITRPSIRGSSVLAEEDAPEFYLLSVIRALREHESLDVTIRPHPSESAAFYKGLLAGEGLWEPRYRFSHGTALKRSLEEADLVVGSPSTTALEAMALGKPLLMLNFCRGSFGPPFDGGSGVPMIASLDELRRELSSFASGTLRSRDYSAIVRGYGGAVDGGNSARVLRALRGIESHGA